MVRLVIWDAIAPIMMSLQCVVMFTTANPSRQFFLIYDGPWRRWLVVYVAFIIHWKMFCSIQCTNVLLGLYWTNLHLRHMIPSGTFSKTIRPEVICFHSWQFVLSIGRLGSAKFEMCPLKFYTKFSSTYTAKYAFHDALKIWWMMIS